MVEIVPLIALREVTKVYRTGRLDYHALKGIDLAVHEGEFVAIAGPSGSGKSTILNIITGIDRPTAGDVAVGGRPLNSMSEEELAVWRGGHVGIVFQFFQLLPTLTALENTMLPLDFTRDLSVPERAGQALRKLDLVGLAAKADHLPLELSGGEQQRVAIARALVADPPILVADEPTGNLDTDTAEHIIELLAKLNVDGTTVLYVTHDRHLAQLANRQIHIRDGQIAPAGTT